MTTYRAGQRVRIEWPTGAVLEGPVTYVAGTQPENWCVLSIGGAVSVDVPGCDGYTVTVLSEPRPDEPTGLGAVVEAQPNCAMKRREFVKFTSTPAHNGWIDDYGDAHAWDDLIDPVVLSEGWTPLEPPTLHGSADAYGLAECHRCMHVRKKHSDAGPCAVGLCQCGEFES